MAVLRIWRARIDSSRAGEYLSFANEQSLPMFRGHAGFLGVIFAARGAERLVLTVWRDMEAVRALDASPRYSATVADIEASGFLDSASPVEVYTIEGGALDSALMSSLVGDAAPA